MGEDELHPALLPKAFFLLAGAELSFPSIICPPPLLPIVHQQGQHVVLMIFKIKIPGYANTVNLAFF